MIRPEEKKPTRQRLLLGGVIFISGFLSPLFIPYVLASGMTPGLKSLLSGLLALGIPELFMVVAAGVLGKPGFNYLKRYIAFLFRRYGPPDTVGPLRYRIGLVLFLTPFLLALVLPYAAAYFPRVANNLVAISIVGDTMLLISLFVLGGDFWDKLKGLFDREAKMQSPKK